MTTDLQVWSSQKGNLASYRRNVQAHALRQKFVSRAVRYAISSGSSWYFFEFQKYPMNFLVFLRIPNCCHPSYFLEGNSFWHNNGNRVVPSFRNQKNILPPCDCGWIKLCTYMTRPSLYRRSGWFVEFGCLQSKNSYVKKWGCFTNKNICKKILGIWGYQEHMVRNSIVETNKIPKICANDNSSLSSVLF